MVLVQDYHLTLVPGCSRRRDRICRWSTSRTLRSRIPNVLRVLPTAVAKELLEGMAGAVALRIPLSHGGSRLSSACCNDARRRGPRDLRVTTRPRCRSHLPSAIGHRRSPRPRSVSRHLVGDRLPIVKVDRVEPSKNLLRGFWAFDELLRNRPDWRGRVVHAALAYSSRQDLPEYLAYGTEVELAARTVNETWGDEDWTPVLLEIADDPARSIAALDALRRPARSTRFVTA